MREVVEGARKFCREEYPPRKEFFQQLAAKRQKPVVLFITCSDSRINPNLITQTEPGDLFVIRNAGNIVPPHGAPAGGEAATIEYSIEVLGIRDIIVCGHSQCGAMQALLDPQAVSNLPLVRAWCSHAEATRRIVAQKYPHLSGPELTVAAIKENVLVQVNHLSTHPSVAARLANGELRIYGWYYDIGAGRIEQYDQARGAFVDVGEEPCATQPLPSLAPEAAIA
jgi:carbonic anhydrase